MAAFTSLWCASSPPNCVASRQFCECVRMGHVGSCAMLIPICYDFCRICRPDFRHSYSIQDQLKNCTTTWFIGDFRESGVTKTCLLGSGEMERKRKGGLVRRPYKMRAELIQWKGNGDKAASIEDTMKTVNKRKNDSVNQRKRCIQLNRQGD